MASTTSEFTGPDLVHLVVGVPQQTAGDRDAQPGVVGRGGQTERLAKDPDEMVFGDLTHHGTGQWMPSHSVGVQELADVVGVNGLGDVAAPSGLVTVAAVPWKATMFWRRGGTTDQPLARRARFWRGTPRWPAGSD